LRSCWNFRRHFDAEAPHQAPDAGHIAIKAPLTLLSSADRSLAIFGTRQRAHARGIFDGRCACF